MNEICEYIEKKKLMDYIQHEIRINNPDEIESFANFELIGSFSSTSMKYLKGNRYDNKKFGASPFLSCMVTEAGIELPEILQAKINDVFEKLNMSLSVRNDITKLIHKIYITDTQRELNISISGDNEFLIYINLDGTFNNVLVNEEGDIELLIIPPDRRKSYNKSFYKEDGINYSKVVSSFNEMR